MVKILNYNVCFYTAVTLRYNWYKRWAYAVRAYYPELYLFIVDNCGNEGSITSVKDTDNLCHIIKNDEILPLTLIQHQGSEALFNTGMDLLVYSADDVIFNRGGFIEKAIEKMLQEDCHIVSLATDKDPVAFIYDRVFFEEVGFNLELKGKENTDNDLVSIITSKYGTFHFIGEYWVPVGDGVGWKSKYLEHAVGRFEDGKKEDVTKKLEKLGIESGVGSNIKLIR